MGTNFYTSFKLILIFSFLQFGLADPKDKSSTNKKTAILSVNAQIFHVYSDDFSNLLKEGPEYEYHPCEINKGCTWITRPQTETAPQYWPLVEEGAGVTIRKTDDNLNTGHFWMYFLDKRYSAYNQYLAIVFGQGKFLSLKYKDKTTNVLINHNFGKNIIRNLVKNPKVSTTGILKGTPFFLNTTTEYRGAAHCSIPFKFSQVKDIPRICNTIYRYSINSNWQIFKELSELAKEGSITKEESTEPKTYHTGNELLELDDVAFKTSESNPSEYQLSVFGTVFKYSGMPEYLNKIHLKLNASISDAINFPAFNADELKKQLKEDEKTAGLAFASIGPKQYEAIYNKLAVKHFITQGKKSILLDKHIVRNVEVCDILYPGSLIHFKIDRGKSSSINHLCGQAIASTELLQTKEYTEEAFTAIIRSKIFENIEIAIISSMQEHKEGLNDKFEGFKNECLPKILAQRNYDHQVQELITTLQDVATTPDEKERLLKTFTAAQKLKKESKSLEKEIKSILPIASSTIPTEADKFSQFYQALKNIAKELKHDGEHALDFYQERVFAELLDILEPYDLKPCKDKIYRALKNEGKLFFTDVNTKAKLKQKFQEFGKLKNIAEIYHTFCQDKKKNKYGILEDKFVDDVYELLFKNTQSKVVLAIASDKEKIEDLPLGAKINLANTIDNLEKYEIGVEIQMIPFAGDFAEILPALETDFQISPTVPTKKLAKPKVHFLAKKFNGFTKMQEIDTRADGDCFFHALEMTPAQIQNIKDIFSRLYSTSDAGTAGEEAAEHKSTEKSPELNLLESNAKLRTRLSQHLGHIFLHDFTSDFPSLVIPDEISEFLIIRKSLLNAYHKLSTHWQKKNLKEQFTEYLDEKWAFQKVVSLIDDDCLHNYLKIYGHGRTGEQKWIDISYEHDYSIGEILLTFLGYKFNCKVECFTLDNNKLKHIKTLGNKKRLNVKYIIYRNGHFQTLKPVEADPSTEEEAEESSAEADPRPRHEDSASDYTASILHSEDETFEGYAIPAESTLTARTGAG